MVFYRLRSRGLGPLVFFHLTPFVERNKREGRAADIGAGREEQIRAERTERLKEGHTWAKGGKGGIHPPPEGQKQVPSPVEEKWVSITRKKSYCILYLLLLGRKVALFVVKVFFIFGF